MKKYHITDHIVISYPDDTQSNIRPWRDKKKYADKIYGDHPINITVRIDPYIYGRFKVFCTKEGSSKREVASEAIAYWILEKKKEAKDLGIEDAYKDWEQIRMKRMENKRESKREKSLASSRRSWTLMHPGKPWPGVDKKPTQVKGDVQTDMNFD